MAVEDATGAVLQLGDQVRVPFKVAEVTTRFGGVAMLVRELLQAGQAATGPVPKSTAVRFAGAFADLQPPGQPVVGATIEVTFTVAGLYQETKSVSLLRERVAPSIADAAMNERTTLVRFGCLGTLTTKVAAGELVPTVATRADPDLPLDID